MTQMVTLGQNLRLQYFGTSMSGTWSFNLSRHFAKGITRTMQSTSALLQGFFPANAKKTGLPGNIQVPPVFSSPIEKDVLFSAQHICPGYVRLLQKLEESPKWIAKKKEYGERFDDWKTLAKVDGGIYSLATFMDRVSIHAMHDLPMPAGISSEDVRALVDLLDWLMASLASERDLAQLVVTPLIGKIIRDFSQIASCLHHNKSSKVSCSRWALYLGSDINILSLLSLMGVPQKKNVDYGAHLDMKLNWDDNTPQISLFFNNSPLNVPGCGTSCHLDTWLEILDNGQSENWESLCNINSGPILNNSNLSHPLPDRLRLEEINKN